LQILSCGVDVGVRQFRIQLHTEDVDQFVPGTSGTGLAQPTDQLLDLAEARHRQRRAYDFHWHHRLGELPQGFFGQRLNRGGQTLAVAFAATQLFQQSKIQFDGPGASRIAADLSLIASDGLAVATKLIGDQLGGLVNAQATEFDLDADAPWFAVGSQWAWWQRQPRWLLRHMLDLLVCLQPCINPS
jgi:hypothetical protein